MDFKEFPKNRLYQFRTLKNDEKFDKLLKKQVICERAKEKEMTICLMFSPGIRRIEENV